MRKKKILCTIISVLLLGTSVCSIYAVDASANLITSNALAVTGDVERVSTPVDFGFEIVSAGIDAVIAEFTSSEAITDAPYIGEKGTDIAAAKVSNLQYSLEYDKEYSFVYTTLIDGVETVYNTFLTAKQENGVEIVFGDIIKNVVTNNLARGLGPIVETEPNDSLTTADTTYDDYDNNGAITSITDIDWWKVKFTKKGKVNFWLGSIPSGCNYKITLYNAAGNQIGYSNNAGQEPELIQSVVSPNTYYYIKIETVFGVSSSRYLLRTKWYPYFDSEVYTIQNVGNGLYLTVGKACNASSLSYAYVYTASNTAEDGLNNGQRMRINYNSADYFTIAPLCSYNGQYRVLDVYGGLSSSAKQIWLYPDNGASEEHFVFELQSDNTYIISFKDSSNYVLDVNASTNKVYANTRSGADSQKWIVTADTTYNAKETLYKTYGWQWPLASNLNLKSSYGRRTLDSGGSYEFHSAVDVSANNGTSVLCPTTASYAHSGRDNKYGCGYFLIVETEDAVYQNSSRKLRLLFQHLMEEATTTNPDISNVATIAQGTTIAKTGDTGSTGSYHLHFGVINDGSNVFINHGNNYDTRTFTNTEQPLMFYPNINFTYN